MNRQKAQEALQKSGMTQKQAAGKIGISQEMFSKYMNSRSTMRVDLAIRTANILGMSVEELFGGCGDGRK